ncbi:MAG: hypothetical protein KGQ49_06495, partial [Verrucomicrobia bacterium]|nr:hypothetical protein [Verrucomicrobiota bacterium]
PGILYRVDRLDIPSQLPKGGSFDDLLDFCKRSFFRINGKEGTTICPIDSPLLRLSYRYSFLRTLYRAMGLLGKVFLKTLRWFYKFIVRILSFDRNVIVHTLSTVRNMIARIQHRLTNKTLHTNACGDFTLMSKKNWEELRGYPEWDLFSWHLDSIVLYQARQHGIQEKDLPMKCAIYHIEHGKGYTPEGAQELFARLSAQKIPYLTNEMLDKTVRDMNASHEKVVYNQADWGFSNLKLKETQITR